MAESKTRKEPHGAVEDSIILFIPFNQMTLRAEMFQISAGDTQNSSDYQVNEAAFNGLVKSAIELLSTRDLVTLNKALRTRDNVSNLVREIARSNGASSKTLYLDGFWNVQKIELLVSALVFISSGDLRPKSNNMIRWICSEIQGHSKGLEAAISSNEPLTTRY